MNLTLVPVQAQVSQTLSFTPVAANTAEINMDHKGLEQALTGAPDWAVNMVKLLVAQSDSVKAEIQELHKAVEFAQSKAASAEQLATKATKNFVDLERKYEEIKMENTKIHDRLEAQSRRDNLLVYGVKEIHGEKEEHLRQWWVDFVKDTLGFEKPAEIKLERTHRKAPPP